MGVAGKVGSPGGRRHRKLQLAEALRGRGGASLRRQQGSRSIAAPGATLRAQEGKWLSSLPGRGGESGSGVEGGHPSSGNRGEGGEGLLKSSIWGCPPALGSCILRGLSSSRWQPGAERETCGPVEAEAASGRGGGAGTRTVSREPAQEARPWKGVLGLDRACPVLSREPTHLSGRHSTAQAGSPSGCHRWSRCHLWWLFWRSDPRRTAGPHSTHRPGCRAAGGGEGRQTMAPRLSDLREPGWYAPSPESLSTPQEGPRYSGEGRGGPTEV